jgi:hypothetical protein
MSASGTYSYWPKVNNPNAQFIQMTSGEYQPPFFFGGSQIPMSLNGNGRGNGISGPEPRPKYTVRPIYKDEWKNEMQGTGGAASTNKGDRKPPPAPRMTPEEIEARAHLNFLENIHSGSMLGGPRRPRRTREQIIKEIGKKVAFLPNYQIPEEYEEIKDEIIEHARNLRQRRGSGLDHATLSISDHNDKIYIPKHLASMHM